MIYTREDVLSMIMAVKTDLSCIRLDFIIHIISEVQEFGVHHSQPRAKVNFVTGLNIVQLLSIISIQLKISDYE